MYFGIWNAGDFLSSWQYYEPFQKINEVNCGKNPHTSTHIEENKNLKSFQENPIKEKKGFIELSKEDLMGVGYETKKKLWSQEEDKMLLKLIDEEKIPWKQIEQHIPERTEKMCYSRYRRLLSQTKQSWTREEDKKIKELVEKYGQNWKQFTINFRNRSSKQIKERYTNYLRSQIKRDHWTLEEDLKIIEYINLYGKKWKKIWNELGNRTDNQIKNRYYGRLEILYKDKIVQEKRKNLKKNRSCNKILDRPVCSVREKKIQ